MRNTEAWQTINDVMAKLWEITSIAGWATAAPPKLRSSTPIVEHWWDDRSPIPKAPAWVDECAQFRRWQVEVQYEAYPDAKSTSVLLDELDRQFAEMPTVNVRSVSGHSRSEVSFEAQIGSTVKRLIVTKITTTATAVIEYLEFV